MKQHYRHGQVAYNDQGAADNVAWFGDLKIYQRCNGNICDRVIVDPTGAIPDQIIEPRYGANGVRAGRNAWHTRLDKSGPTPTLSFSTGAETLVGYEGDVAANADVSVVLDREKTLMRVIEAGLTVRTVTLPGGVMGSPWVDQTGTWAVMSCFQPELKLTLVHLPTGDRFTPVCVTAQKHYSAACVALGPEAKDVYVAYFTDEYGLVIHPAFDPTRRMTLATKGSTVLSTDACILEDRPADVSIVWADNDSMFGPEQRVYVPIETLLALPAIEVPPVEDPPAPSVVPPNVERFALAGTWFPDTSWPGNLVVIGNKLCPIPAGACVVSQAEHLDTIPSSQLAGLLVYLTEDDATVKLQIAKSIQIAAVRRLPMFIYDDRRDGRFALIKAACGNAPWVWVPMWYLNVGEDPATFAATVIALANKCGGHPMLPSIRAYCSVTGEGVDKVPEAAVIAALNELVKQDALKIKGFLGPLFFAWDRGDGITHRPAIRTAIDVWIETPTTVTSGRSFADAMCPPAPPVVEPPPPPPPVEPPPIPPVPPMTNNDLEQLGDESRASAILIAYETLLNRKPDLIGIDIYTKRLKDEGWTVDEMEADIKTSPEYQSLHPAPIPIPPGGGPLPSLHGQKFGASYATGLSNPAFDAALFAGLNRDAGGNYTRIWMLDAWAIGPNGPGQYAGIVPWLRDSAGVFNLNAPNPAWDERLNAHVRIHNAAGAVCHLSVLELYTWSDRKQGLLWVPDQNIGPFRKNRNGVRWGNPDDPTFEALPDEVLKAFIARICAAVRGQAVWFECGNEMPEKEMHAKIATELRSHFTPDWQPEITVNRQEDTPGQYANMKIGTNYDKIAYHGKDSLAYLDEDFDREPVHRTFRSMWTDPAIDPKRTIFSSDGCRASASSVENAYDWPTLKEVFQDHWRRGCSLEHLSRCKMRPFLEGRLDLRADFETEWLLSIRT